VIAPPIKGPVYCILMSHTHEKHIWATTRQIVINKQAEDNMIGSFDNPPDEGGWVRFNE